MYKRDVKEDGEMSLTPRTIWVKELQENTKMNFQVLRHIRDIDKIMNGTDSPC